MYINKKTIEILYNNVVECVDNTSKIEDIDNLLSDNFFNI